jgi:hypothetical protein
MRRLLPFAVAGMLVVLLIVPVIALLGTTVLARNAAAQEAQAEAIRAREQQLRAEAERQRAEAERQRLLAEQARQDAQAAAQRAEAEARVRQQDLHAAHGAGAGQRARHLLEAAEHLRAAGYEEQSRDLVAEAERLQRESGPATMEHVQRQLAELHQQVDALRRELHELRQLVQQARGEPKPM